MNQTSKRQRISVIAAVVALALVPGLVATTIPGPILSLGSNSPSPMEAIRAGMPAESSDLKIGMPNPFDYEYIPGDELSDKPGSGSVYQAELIGNPQSVLTRVASALGLSGSAKEAEYSIPDYPSFVVGSTDGSAPSASITWSGTGNWWFSNPAAYPMAKCLTEAKAEDGTTYCSAYEEFKATPELIPSEAAIKAEATKVFTAVGAPANLGEIRTYRDDFSAYASAALQVAGQDTPFEWSIAWGSNGEVGSVSGHSAKFVPRGEFGTVSAKAAVKRIDDWRYSGGVASSIWGNYSVGLPVASPLVRAIEEPAPQDGAVDDAQATPEKVLVTITKSEEALVSIWAADGSVWLVPGFLLVSDQGAMTPLFSLIDGVVKLPVWSPELIAY